MDQQTDRSTKFSKLAVLHCSVAQ